MGFSTVFKPRDTSDARLNTPILLDGGLGTTLEDVFHKDIAHPLWSAKLVDNEEDVIVAAHLAFLQAGARVILTSTYQAAYETFSRAHYTKSDAERLMLKSVELAVKAREKYEQILSQTNGSSPRAKIALSLGPYGATLQPAAEFTGIYPLPYGPSQISPSSIVDHDEGPGSLSEIDNTTHANALAAFHFSRLLVYARNTDLWNAIDLLAFETTPLVTEAKAIRTAVAMLEHWFQDVSREEIETMTSARMKPWYMSFVFPGPSGEFIQIYPVADQLEETQIVGSFRSTKIPRAYTSYEVARAALTPGNAVDQRKMAVPDAIGVNCTSCHAIAPIIEGFASAVRDMWVETLRQTEELPWLVLYPNGGLTYDPVGRTWIDRPLVSQGQVEGHEKGTWAKRLAELIEKRTTDINVFGGLLIGGCCKTGPNEIRDLCHRCEHLGR